MCVKLHEYVSNSTWQNQFWYTHIFMSCIWKQIRLHFCFKVDSCKLSTEKVYLRSQILERPSIGGYWNISGVPVLSENVIFTFFRTCWCYSEAYNTGMQKWSNIVQYSCTSIWDFKYPFSLSTFADYLKLVFFFFFKHYRVHINMHTILPCPVVSFLYCVFIQQNTLSFFNSFMTGMKISTDCVYYSSCHSWYCAMNSIKSFRTFPCVFLHRAMQKGNQHGGQKCSDLQNWLDMMSHEDPLLIILTSIP